MKIKKTKKLTKEAQLRKEIDSYSNKRVGIIKGVKIGLLPGSVLGAFAVMHDGGFGLSITILEIEHGFPLNYRLTNPKECEQFFKDMDVIWHTELKGKHVLLLSNSDVINSVEKVVPHKRLMESLKEVDKNE